MVRTGALPALRYGAGVIGANKSILPAPRSFACGVQSEMRGRCAFARARKYNPGVVLATDPLLEWAHAAWDGSSCDEDMAVAWRPAVQLAGPSAFAFINGQGAA